MPNVRKSSIPAQRPAQLVAQESNKLQRRRQRHTGKSLDFDSIDADQLLRAVQNVLRKGVGITFGVTRDKGALSVTLLSDGETDREYVRATEDINGYLAGLEEDFTE